LPVNCGAVSEHLVESELFGNVRGAFTGAEREKIGIFEAAGGGYVFLDEIGDMPLNQQAKLLRTLQERTVQKVGEVEPRPVSFRSISAAHKPLKRAIEEGKFREDLFFRVSKEVIEVPPLGERLEDIRELAIYFLGRQSRQRTITDEAIRLLQAYRWPGNVRQLESVIEAMVIRCDGIIRGSHVLQVLPELAELSQAQLNRAIFSPLGQQLLNQERARFQKAILDANGDRTLAAKNLGLPRSTFFRKASQLGLVQSRRQSSLRHVLPQQIE
jgi:transcriptional regulator with PAS, ATPase and Fis domain